MGELLHFSKDLVGNKDAILDFSSILQEIFAGMGWGVRRDDRGTKSDSLVFDFD